VTKAVNATHFIPNGAASAAAPTNTVI
jgi:hypothetical protein